MWVNDLRGTAGVIAGVLVKNIEKKQILNMIYLTGIS